MNTPSSRSLEAVFYPGNYAPFPDLASASHFQRAWEGNPAWVMANMAHAAYCAPETVRPLLHTIGAETRFYASGVADGPLIRGRQAFLGLWEDKAILSFRGTEITETLRLKTPETLRRAVAKWGGTLPDVLDTFLATDILDDLHFTLAPYKHARVHKGFLDATLELWPRIEKDLQDRCTPSGTPVYVTGHSLGGAMAVIAGMTFPFARIVTFGAPRVGQDLQQALGDPTLHVRYVNGNDPVPWIVPSVYPFRYRHFGDLRKIVDPVHGPSALYDHAIVNYAAVLRDAATPF